MKSIETLDIHIIGKGKLGRSLSAILQRSHIPHALYGRDFPHHLQGIVYICVSEDLIESVAHTLSYHKDCVVVHASGTLGLDVFPPHALEVGCLHPIQSFPGPEVHLPSSVPATLLSHEQASLDSINKMKQLAHCLEFSLYPFIGNRLTYHTAAVLSGNFTTILFSLATELLIKEGYSGKQASELLYSLAAQSLENASKGTLEEVLTGPIARQQKDVLQKQQQNLSWDPLLEQLYDTFVDVANQRLQKDCKD